MLNVQNAEEGRSPLKYHFPTGLDHFSLFQISLENFFDIKFRLWQEHKLDPVWIENIPYYEFQIWLDKLNVVIEEENNENLEESGKKNVFTLRR